MAKKKIIAIFIAVSFSFLQVVPASFAGSSPGPIFQDDRVKMPATSALDSENPAADITKKPVSVQRKPGDFSSGTDFLLQGPLSPITRESLLELGQPIDHDPVIMPVEKRPAIDVFTPHPNPVVIPPQDTIVVPEQYFDDEGRIIKEIRADGSTVEYLYGDVDLLGNGYMQKTIIEAIFTRPDGKQVKVDFYGDSLNSKESQFFESGYGGIRGPMMAAVEAALIDLLGKTEIVGGLIFKNASSQPNIMCTASIPGNCSGNTVVKFDFESRAEANSMKYEYEATVPFGNQEGQTGTAILLNPLSVFVSNFVKDFLEKLNEHGENNYSSYLYYYENEGRYGVRVQSPGLWLAFSFYEGVNAEGKDPAPVVTIFKKTDSAVVGRPESQTLFDSLKELGAVTDQDKLVMLVEKIKVTSSGSGEIFFTKEGKDYRVYRDSAQNVKLIQILSVPSIAREYANGLVPGLGDNLSSVGDGRYYGFYNAGDHENGTLRFIRFFIVLDGQTPRLEISDMAFMGAPQVIVKGNILMDAMRKMKPLGLSDRVVFDLLKQIKINEPFGTVVSSAGKVHFTLGNANYEAYSDSNNKVRLQMVVGDTYFEVISRDEIRELINSTLIGADRDLARKALNWMVYDSVYYKVMSKTGNVIGYQCEIKALNPTAMQKFWIPENTSPVSSRTEIYSQDQKIGEMQTFILSPKGPALIFSRMPSPKQPIPADVVKVFDLSTGSLHSEIRYDAKGAVIKAVYYQYVKGVLSASYSTVYDAAGVKAQHVIRTYHSNGVTKSADDYRYANGVLTTRHFTNYDASGIVSVSGFVTYYQYDWDSLPEVQALEGSLVLPATLKSYDASGKLIREFMVDKDMKITSMAVYGVVPMSQLPVKVVAYPQGSNTPNSETYYDANGAMTKTIYFQYNWDSLPQLYAPAGSVVFPSALKHFDVNGNLIREFSLDAQGKMTSMAVYGSTPISQVPASVDVYNSQGVLHFRNFYNSQGGYISGIHEGWVHFFDLPAEQRAFIEKAMDELLDVAVQNGDSTFQSFFNPDYWKRSFFVQPDGFYDTGTGGTGQGADFGMAVAAGTLEWTMSAGPEAWDVFKMTIQHEFVHHSHFVAGVDNGVQEENITRIESNVFWGMGFFVYDPATGNYPYYQASQAAQAKAQLRDGQMVIGVHIPLDADGSIFTWQNEGVTRPVYFLNKYPDQEIPVFVMNEMIIKSMMELLESQKGWPEKEQILRAQINVLQGSSRVLANPGMTYPCIAVSYDAQGRIAQRAKIMEAGKPPVSVETLIPLQGPPTRVVIQNLSGIVLLDYRYRNGQLVSYEQFVNVRGGVVAVQKALAEAWPGGVIEVPGEGVINRDALVVPSGVTLVFGEGILQQTAPHSAQSNNSV